jgi:hypothetical protein
MSGRALHRLTKNLIRVLNCTSQLTAVVVWMIGWLLGQETCLFALSWYWQYRSFRGAARGGYLIKTMCHYDVQLAPVFLRGERF